MRDALSGQLLGRGTASNTLLADGNDTAGCAAMFIGLVNPQHTAPDHHQPTEEEAFYVLDGEVALTCGSQTAVIGPGAFGFAPRYATHGFTTTGQTQSRMLSINSPAGHERGFEMMLRERANPSGRFMQLMAAHGWQMHRTVNP